MKEKVDTSDPVCIGLNQAWMQFCSISILKKGHNAVLVRKNVLNIPVAGCESQHMENIACNNVSTL